MKKFFTGLFLFAFILNIISGVAYGMAAFDMDTEKYFCPKKPDSAYNFLDLYVPSKDCSSYQSFIPAYNHCIKKNAELKARFDAGLCEKVLVKEHIIGGAKCKAEVLEKSETHISTQCSGRHTSSALRSVKKYYGDEEDYEERYRSRHRNRYRDDYDYDY